MTMTKRHVVRGNSWMPTRTGGGLTHLWQVRRCMHSDCFLQIRNISMCVFFNYVSIWAVIIDCARKIKWKYDFFSTFSSNIFLCFLIIVKILHVHKIINMFLVKKLFSSWVLILHNLNVIEYRFIYRSGEIFFRKKYQKNKRLIYFLTQTQIQMNNGWKGKWPLMALNATFKRSVK